uniref:Uncharacterized protein n=1 Tax=Arundo donax TaxID=35708 RepID=A0A0A9F0E9_ARUDO
MCILFIDIQINQLDPFWWYLKFIVLKT